MKIGGVDIPSYLFMVAPGDTDESVIITGDGEQLWYKILAYAGMPSEEENASDMLPWVQDVLCVLSEIYPDSSAKGRLLVMVNFSNWCKEKRKC